jgi:hypothetical protein
LRTSAAGAGDQDLRRLDLAVFHYLPNTEDNAIVDGRLSGIAFVGWQFSF